MRRLRMLPILSVLLFVTTYGHAQQVDVAFGVGTLLAPSASSASANYTAQSMGGGTFLAVSGDVLIKHNLGIDGEVAWRATQNTYGGYEPFRPLLFDFNGIWTRRFGRIAPELLGGIGASSTRFYTPYLNYSALGGYTDYTSSTHFMGDFGGGVKLYVHGPIFVRPEARVYLIHNNFEFSSGRAERVGVSVGYTFGGGDGN